MIQDSPTSKKNKLTRIKMAEIINAFLKGNNNIVKKVINDGFATKIYFAIKRTSEQEAIFFMEQYRHYKFTGNVL